MSKLIIDWPMRSHRKQALQGWFLQTGQNPAEETIQKTSPRDQGAWLVLQATHEYMAGEPRCGKKVKLSRADHKWGWKEPSHSACVSHFVCEFLSSLLSARVGVGGILAQPTPPSVVSTSELNSGGNYSSHLWARICWSKDYSEKGQSLMAKMVV